MTSFKPKEALLALALTCAAIGGAWADTIVLKDGDRITGAITKKDGQAVTIQSKNFGTVTFKWDDIATVTTDQPLNVVLAGDKTVKATLKTQDGRIEVSSAGTPQTVSPNEVVALRNDASQKSYERMLHPRLFDLWTITGSLNLAGTKGNAETSTITVPVNFLRVSNTSRTSAYFNAIRSTASFNSVSQQTAQAVRGGWGYSRNITSRLFFNGFNDYEVDKFQSLDLRVVIGGGLGYQVWKSDAGRLAAVGGVAWNRESFSPVKLTPFTRNTAEGFWGDDFDYKLSSRTSLVQSFRMFNNLSDGGQYRMNFDAGAAIKLTKWLNWNVSLSNRYLSNPVAGRKSSDLLYTAGLGFTLAR